MKIAMKRSKVAKCSSDFEGAASVGASCASGNRAEVRMALQNLDLDEKKIIGIMTMSPTEARVIASTLNAMADSAENMEAENLTR